ncbi:J domain-containing protein [Ralstonia holmesii]|uniref:J domain-containing protein n=1 Tax=Ralstonia holmesii TaxID=3058602 RepID=UPI00293122B4|nr:J domain-containing protein [Ralstonia sp. LMG 32967]
MSSQHGFDGSTTYSRGRKALTVADGVNRVLLELRRLGVDEQDTIISTNVPTRLDGLPRSGVREPDDPGAAVYWEERGGARRVMAIDQYLTVADNLAAIAATLEAMRAIERHGGAQILERAFTGFTALPSPGAEKSWQEVLGVPPDERDIEAVRAAFRRQAAQHHPDRGGSLEQMAAVNAAWQQAKVELGVAP